MGRVLQKCVVSLLFVLLDFRTFTGMTKPKSDILQEENTVSICNLCNLRGIPAHTKKKWTALRCNMQHFQLKISDISMNTDLNIMA